jgi:hypothetical protein
LALLWRPEAERFGRLRFSPAYAYTEENAVSNEVTYRVLPQSRSINAQALLCAMRGHKVDLREKDGATTTFCYECGYGLHIAPTPSPKATKG